MMPDIINPAIIVSLDNFGDEVIGKLETNSFEFPDIYISLSSKENDRLKEVINNDIHNLENDHFIIAGKKGTRFSCHLIVLSKNLSTIKTYMSELSLNIGADSLLKLFPITFIFHKYDCNSSDVISISDYDKHLFVLISDQTAGRSKIDSADTTRTIAGLIKILISSYFQRKDIYTFVNDDLFNNKFISVKISDHKKALQELYNYLQLRLRRRLIEANIDFSPCNYGKAENDLLSLIKAYQISEQNFSFSRISSKNDQRNFRFWKTKKNILENKDLLSRINSSVQVRFNQYYNTSHEEGAKNKNKFEVEIADRLKVGVVAKKILYEIRKRSNNLREYIIQILLVGNKSISEFDKRLFESVKEFDVFNKTKSSIYTKLITDSESKINWKNFPQVNLFQDSIKLCSVKIVAILSCILLMFILSLLFIPTFFKSFTIESISVIIVLLLALLGYFLFIKIKRKEYLDELRKQINSNYNKVHDFFDINFRSYRYRVKKDELLSIIKMAKKTSSDLITQFLGLENLLGEIKKKIEVVNHIDEHIFIDKEIERYIFKAKVLEIVVQSDLHDETFDSLSTKILFNSLRKIKNELPSSNFTDIGIIKMLLEDLNKKDFPCDNNMINTSSHQKILFLNFDSYEDIINKIEPPLYSKKGNGEINKIIPSCLATSFTVLETVNLSH